MLFFKIVQEGLIEITPEDGIKDSKPTCSLLENDGFRVLIDLEHPKEDGTGFKDALGRLGLLPSKIDAVIFTHLHPDHMGHKNLFPQVDFVFHKDEKFVFYFKNDKSVQLSGSALIELTPEGITNPEHVGEVPDLSSLGDRVYMHHTPGHTRGSYAIFANIEGKVHAFVGDMWLTKDYYDRWEAPGSSWEEEKVYEHMDFVKEHADIIIPGHGPPFENIKK
jgi:glyoxylase-like metal-dependent hydrolase (beta-lactamase superfamily II)